MNDDETLADIRALEAFLGQPAVSCETFSSRRRLLPNQLPVDFLGMEEVLGILRYDPNTFEITYHPIK